MATTTAVDADASRPCPPQDDSSHAPPSPPCSSSLLLRGRLPAFDVIVVTSPDGPSAAAADEGPLRTLRRSLALNRRCDDEFGDDKGNDGMTSDMSNPLVLSTSDPYGARLGSGGGTLAALDAADAAWEKVDERRRPRRRKTADKETNGQEKWRSTKRKRDDDRKGGEEEETVDGGEKNDDDDEVVHKEEEKVEEVRADPPRPPTVLIVHAGGESSRCPTQMALGKAWTSLPVAVSSSSSSVSPPAAATASAADGENKRDGDSKNDDDDEIIEAAPPSPMAAVVTDPTSILLSTLSSLFGGSRCGTKGVDQKTLPLPRGSVVVAAGDVLLSLGKNDDTPPSSAVASHSSLLEVNENDEAVIGLAVPAPLRTAKNHGVFVLDDDDNGNVDGGDASSVLRPARSFLQKPSIETLRSTPGAAFHVGAASSSDRGTDEEAAWIDTGVVTFPPRAASALRRLASNELRCCTERGMKALHVDEVKRRKTAGEAGAPPPLEDFARRVAPRVELYSHLLLALSVSSPSRPDDNENRRRAAYLASHRNDGVSPGILASIYDALSPFRLKAAAMDGGFIHLGTTAELLDFVVEGVLHGDGNSIDSGTSNENGDGGTKEAAAVLCRDFGRRIGLTRRAASFVHGIDASPTSVVLNSVLCGGLAPSSFPVTTEDADVGGQVDGEEEEAPSTIGSGTVVEHSSFDAPAGLDVGAGCLISGLRGRASRRRLTIPDGICLQLLPLKWHPEDDDNGGGRRHSESFVCLCLGVRDEIKQGPCPMLYGMKTTNIFQVSGLSPSDIWDDDIPQKKRTLWNARLHPVVAVPPQSRTKDDDDAMELDFMGLTPLGFIAALRDLIAAGRNKGGGDETSSARQFADLHLDAALAVQAWRSLPRLALSEVRGQCDALAEFRYREAIVDQGIKERKRSWSGSVREVLLRRRHVPCDFGFVLDSARHGASGADVNLALSTLDGATVDAAKGGQYDACGRAFMVTALMLLDLADVSGRGGNVTSDKSIPAIPQEGNFEREIEALRTPSMVADDDGKGRRAAACQTIFSSLRAAITGGENSYLPPPSALHFYATLMERAAAAMTELCVSFQHTENFIVSADCRVVPAPRDSWVVATAPARCDLSGGWSDTPPLSYEYGGAVAGLAVAVDGRKPLSCRCRVVTGGKSILLSTECRDLKGHLTSDPEEVRLDSMEDLSDYRDPLAACALIKCALVYLRVAPLDRIQGGVADSLQPYINAFCGSDADVGLEVISASLLPRGSGMGTSSILGGCILASIGKCVGIDVVGGTNTTANSKTSDHDDRLIQAVLVMEQLLTTGGGWQDQVGGLVGGMKLGLSDKHVVPLRTKVKRKMLEPTTKMRLNERMLLVFTGQPRLAKNLLQNVLRRWARRQKNIVETVRLLVMGGKNAARAVETGDLDELGRCLRSYWDLKKNMVGKGGGAEPLIVGSLLKELYRQNHISGGTLCGAGGGGFLLLLAREGKTGLDLQRVIREDFPGDLPEFTFHSCQVSEEGLTTKVIDQTNKGDVLFDIKWHDLN